MKKFLFFSFLPLFVLSGCSPNYGGRGSVDRERVLIVGTNATYPPYESVDEQGRIVGFDIDIAKELGVRLGKSVEVRELAFDALILSLKRGRIDLIISGMSVTPARLKEIFMVPYQGEEIENLFLISKQALTEDPGNFSQYSSVAVQSGTFQEEYLLSLRGVHVRSFDSVAELVMEVRYDKSPVAVLEPSVGQVTIEEFPEFFHYLVPLPNDQKIFGYGIGVSKAKEDLYEQIVTHIREMKTDGTIRRLERKWNLRKD
ncbi:transporter substrate-binding domain-containing protein [Chlamydiifrater phoenicopteri]|uniref:transporter substrate-binding domain-containing protein n=1 Tax=Chlamydiifrater phoenicopteri TaxID=2681469 RepID=UPI001BCE1CE0|nr:transporter substrate-binding domain-containing protein [Chlamydiifrater phoenicopteri]